MRVFTFKISGIKSVLCVNTIERAVCALEGVDAVCVDISSGLVRIRCHNDGVAEETIQSVILEAGYNAVKLPGVTAADKQEDGLRQSCRIAAIIAVIAALAAFSLYFRWLLPLKSEHILLLASAECLCGLGALYIGRQIILEGFHNLFYGRPCMESLTAVSVSAAMLYSLLSLYDLYMGNRIAAGNIYAAAVALILLWSIGGEYFASEAERREKKTIVSVRPAQLLRNGTEHTVTADMLFTGDLVVVRQGENIPADGIAESGNAAVDESDFTGNSIPVLKEKGMKVMAGSYVFGGELTVKVLKTAEKLHDMHEEVRESKAAVSTPADKRAAFFLPLILIVAVAVSLNWLFYSGSFGLAGKVFTSILLVTCPCALKMGQAAALLRTLQQAAVSGIYCRSAGPLNIFKDISVVIFGKTGTITDRKIVMTDIVTYNGVQKDAALTLAASLENSSLHPAASALREHVAEENLLACEKLQYLPGQGISAICQKVRVCFGTFEYVKKSCRILAAAAELTEKWRQEGKMPLFLAAGRTLCAAFAMAEEVPSSGKDVVIRLQEQGIRSILMSGDSKEAAMRAAELTGIKKYMGALSPEEKLELVSSISMGGEKVAVVSGCHNDCLAECKADIRIAVGCRQSACDDGDAADVLLAEGNLPALLRAIQLSRKLEKVDRQGVMLFYLLTTMLLPVAAGAFYFLQPGLLAQPLYVFISVLTVGVLLLLNARRI